MNTKPSQIDSLQASIMAATCCFARVMLRLALFMPLLQFAHAEVSDTTSKSDVGQATRTWLNLQRGNMQAAPGLPTLGAEAGYAYRRYLKSFQTTVPDSFGSSLKTSGASNQANGLPAGVGGTN
ncbi:DUF3613 domain-containing protein [Paraburkholderia lycopersici]|uniref:DUF3613 domain-containing protein n=1 Tax=Paraburkholderia lycopersici TaxID=416944 RepID=A0A1G7BG91_9BURK|nr:DUF3613 domain-containing protein [Paraburkholderia lycopersici]SDE25887.1 Protein of unknown function [Paraburkholderia lycopersici]